MNQYLLDTNHVSAIFQKRPAIINRLQASLIARDRFAICLPSIGELWFMVFNSARIEKNTLDLDQLLTSYIQLEYDGRAAMEFGRIKTELRRAGRPIPDVDAQIAAVAKVNGHVLLTADAHFANVPLILTENWLVP